MKAVGYVRVSTHIQSEEGQLNRVKEIAESKGLEIEQIFIDHGFYPAQERPGFNELLELMKKEPLTIVVSSLDRIYRNNENLHEFINEIKEYGGNVVSGKGLEQ